MVTHLEEIAPFKEPLPRLRGFLQLRDVRPVDDLVVLPRQREHPAEHRGLTVDLRVRWFATNFWHDGHCAVGVQDRSLPAHEPSLRIVDA